MNILMGVLILCAVLLAAFAVLDKDDEFKIVKRIIYVILAGVLILLAMSVSRVASANHTDYYEGITKYDQAVIDLYRSHMESQTRVTVEKQILLNGMRYMEQSRQCAAFWAASLPFMEAAAKQGVVSPEMVEVLQHTITVTSVHLTLYAKSLETFIGTNKFNADSYLHVSETIGTQELKQYIDTLLSENRQEFTAEKGEYCQALYNRQIMLSEQGSVIVEMGMTVDEFIAETNKQKAQ